MCACVGVCVWGCVCCACGCAYGVHVCGVFVSILQKTLRPKFPLPSQTPAKVLDNNATLSDN